MNSQKQNKELLEKRRERIMAVSMGEAFKWGGGGMALSGAGVVGASMKYPNFAKYMQVSAKVSIPIMTGLFLFALNYELSIHKMSTRPDDYGLTDDVIKSGVVTNMPVHHRLGNWLYDHPFAMIAATGTPVAAHIFNTQMKFKHLKVR